MATSDHEMFVALALAYIGELPNGDPMVAEAVLRCAILGAWVVVDRGPKVLRMLDGMPETAPRVALGAIGRKRNCQTMVAARRKKRL